MDANVISKSLVTVKSLFKKGVHVSFSEHFPTTLIGKHQVKEGCEGNS